MFSYKCILIIFFYCFVLPTSGVQVRRWTGAASSAWTNDANWDSASPLLNDTVEIGTVPFTFNPVIQTIDVTLTDLKLESVILAVFSGASLLCYGIADVSNSELRLLDNAALLLPSTTMQFAANGTSMDMASLRLHNNAKLFATGPVLIEGGTVYVHGDGSTIELQSLSVVLRETHFFVSFGAELRLVLPLDSYTAHGDVFLDASSIHVGHDARMQVESVVISTDCSKLSTLRISANDSHSSLSDCDLCVDGLLNVKAPGCDLSGTELLPAQGGVVFENLRVRVRGVLSALVHEARRTMLNMNTRAPNMIEFADGGRLYLEKNGRVSLFDETYFVCDHCSVLGCENITVSSTTVDSGGSFIFSSTMLDDISLLESDLSVQCNALSEWDGTLNVPVFRGVDSEYSVPTLRFIHLNSESGYFWFDVAFSVRFSHSPTEFMLEIGVWRSERPVLLLTSLGLRDDRSVSYGSMHFGHPDSELVLVGGYQTALVIDNVRIESTGRIAFGGSVSTAMKELHLVNGASFTCKSATGRLLFGAAVIDAVTPVYIEEGSAVTVSDGAWLLNANENLNGFFYPYMNIMQVVFRPPLLAERGGLFEVLNGARIALYGYDEKRLLKVGLKDASMSVRLDTIDVVLASMANIEFGGAGVQLRDVNVTLRARTAAIYFYFVSVLMERVVFDGTFNNPASDQNYDFKSSTLTLSDRVEFRAGRALVQGTLATFLLLPHTELLVDGANFTLSVPVIAVNCTEESRPRVLFGTGNGEEHVLIGSTWTGPLDIMVAHAHMSFAGLSLHDTVLSVLDGAVGTLDSDVIGDDSSLFLVDGGTVMGQDNAFRLPWMVRSGGALKNCDVYAPGTCDDALLQDVSLYDLCDMRRLQVNSHIRVEQCTFNGTIPERLPLLAALRDELGASSVCVGGSAQCCVRLMETDESTLLYSRANSYVLIGENVNARLRGEARGTIEFAAKPRGALAFYEDSMPFRVDSTIRLHSDVRMVFRVPSEFETLGTFEPAQASTTNPAIIHSFGPCRMAGGIDQLGVVRGGEWMHLFLHANQYCSAYWDARRFASMVLLDHDAEMIFFSAVFEENVRFTALPGSYLSTLGTPNGDRDGPRTITGPGTIVLSGSTFNMSGIVEMFDMRVEVDGGHLLFDSSLELQCTNVSIVVSNAGTLTLNGPRYVNGSLEIDVRGEDSSLVGHVGEGSFGVDVGVFVRDDARLIALESNLVVSGALLISNAVIVRTRPSTVDSDSLEPAIIALGDVGLNAVRVLLLSESNWVPATADILLDASDAVSFECADDVVVMNGGDLLAQCVASQLLLAMSASVVSKHTCAAVPLQASLDMCLACLESSCAYAVEELFTNVFGASCHFIDGLVDTLDSNGGRRPAANVADCYGLVQPRCHRRDSEADCVAANGLAEHFVSGDSTRRCAWCGTFCMTESEALDGLCTLSGLVMLPPLDNETSDALFTTASLPSVALTATTTNTGIAHVDSVDPALVGTGVVAALVALVIIGIVILFFVRPRLSSVSNRSTNVSSGHYEMSSLGGDTAGSGGGVERASSSTLPSVVDKVPSVASSSSNNTPIYGVMSSSASAAEENAYAVGELGEGNEYRQVKEEVPVEDVYAQGELAR